MQSVAGWAPTDSAHEPDWEFRLYRGNGFAIVIPRSARITESAPRDTGAHITTFSGADINVRGKWSHNVDTVEREGAAFALTVATRPNSDHRTLKAIAAANAHADSLNSDELDPPSHMSLGTIAGQPVLITHSSSGDSAPTDVMFVSPTTIVEFSWNIDDQDLLLEVTEPLYWYMLSTFRWTDTTARR